MPVEVTLGVEFTGQNLLLGPVPTLLAMQGSLTINGDTATLSGLAPVDVSDTQMPGLVLPPLPFALPTILPPGDTANVLFNLTLNELTTALQGTLSITATGAVVPEPTSAGILAISAMCIRRRRRT
jgi:hypothetical protein